MLWPNYQLECLLYKVRYCHQKEWFTGTKRSCRVNKILVQVPSFFEERHTNLQNLNQSIEYSETLKALFNKKKEGLGSRSQSTKSRRRRIQVVLKMPLSLEVSKCTNYTFKLVPK